MMVCKLLILAFSYSIFLIHFVMACDFDMISDRVSEVPITNVKYTKVKREISSTFSPLRIHLHFGFLESDVTHSVLEGLKKILKKAISRVSELIHVIPVSGPLLLQRLGCGGNWTFGTNKGLCSRVRNGYKGEFCENKIDFFQIPSGHLMSLDIFNSVKNVPVHTYPAGKGILNADFILYVSARVSDWCQKQNIQAYASYCRLDQNSRPVAGFINFCPNHLNAKFDSKHLYYVAIHELFHCLGFSKDMFMKFNSCKLGSNYCTDVKRIVVKDDNEVHRLILPSVVQQMKKHFNCTNHDFGAPLEIKDDGSYGSHWDPLLMYGSIMAPSISEPDFTFIDPITLSVFEDTGWYKVNLSASDSYPWAKGKGCNFGFEGTCEINQSHQLCSTSDQNTSFTGCDYLHYTKTTCQRIGAAHSCGIFKPNMKEDCRQTEVPFDIYRGQANPSRCFVSKKNNKTEAVCAGYQCKSPSEIEIFFNGSRAVCFNQSSVYLHETVIVCPRGYPLCFGDSVKSSLDFFETGRTLVIFPDHNFRHVISVKIIIDYPKPQELFAFSKLEEFKVASIVAVASEIDIPLFWIEDSLLTAYHHLTLHFTINPSSEISIDELSNLLKRTQSFLKQKLFSFIYVVPQKDISVVSLTMQFNPEFELTTYDSEGLELFLVLCASCSLCVFVVAVVVFQRYFVSYINHWCQTLVLNRARERKVSELDNIICS